MRLGKEGSGAHYGTRRILGACEVGKEARLVLSGSGKLLEGNFTPRPRM